MATKQSEQGENREPATKKRPLDEIRGEIDECVSSIQRQKMKLTVLKQELDEHPSAIAERLCEWGVPAIYWSRVTHLSTVLEEAADTVVRGAGCSLVQRDDWYCRATLDGVRYTYGAFRWTGEGWDSDDLCVGLDDEEDWESVWAANGTDRQTSRLAASIACMAYYAMRG